MANFNSNRFINIANASTVERLHVRKDTRTGGSNTVFVDTANTLYYELYVNGIHLENSDYTVGNNQIDIHHALDPTDEVEIVRFGGNAPLNMPSDPLEKQSTSYTGTTSTVFSVNTTQNTEHEVYINGLHLTANMYTVSSGSLTLTGVTPVANDVIEIVEFSGVQFVSTGDIVSNAYLTSELAGVGGGGGSGDVSNTYLQAQGYLTTEVGDVSNTYLQATFDAAADVSNTYLQTVLGGGGSGDVSNTYLQATFDAAADVSNTYLQATFDAAADVSNTYLQSGTSLLIKDSTGSTLKTIKSIP